MSGSRVASARGLTLVELLVVLALLSGLGTALVLMLRQAVKAWRAGEAQRTVLVSEQQLVRRLGDDVAAAFTARPPVRLPDASRARWIVDRDPRGRQRLVFVRTSPVPGLDPLEALAGVALGGQARIDRRDDRAEALAGRLAPTGGLREVAWYMDPRGGTTLWRAHRAPPGGEGSLFDPAVLDDPERAERVGSPFLDGVLYFGIACWGEWTRGWDDPEAPAARLWDSSRGSLPDEIGRAAGFFAARGPGWERDPTDDVFPLRVRFELVFEQPPPAGAWTVLREPLSARGELLHVEDARPLRAGLPWVWLEGEWIRCAWVSPVLLRVLPGGRGARGTEPRAHPALAPLTTGVRVQFELPVPCGRERWER